MNQNHNFMASLDTSPLTPENGELQIPKKWETCTFGPLVLHFKREMFLRDKVGADLTTGLDTQGNIVRNTPGLNQALFAEFLQQLHADLPSVQILFAPKDLGAEQKDLTPIIEATREHVERVPVPPTAKPSSTTSP